MLGKFVVGWDLPMGMPQGVMRLVNLQEPAWTCLFCTPYAFATVQDDWQALRVRMVDDVRHISGWCFFAFESIQSNCALAPEGQIRRRLMQAALYLDDALQREDFAQNESALGMVEVANPSTPIFLSRLNTKGLPPLLFGRNQHELIQEWIEQGLKVAFEPGWQDHWRQLGSSPMRGFMHLHTGFWFASNHQGKGQVWDHLTRIAPTLEQRERLLTQAESLWSMSAASSKPVAATLEPEHFVALHQRDPQLAMLLIDELAAGYSSQQSHDAREKFVHHQYELCGLSLAAAVSCVSTHPTGRRP